MAHIRTAIARRIRNMTTAIATNIRSSPQNHHLANYKLNHNINRIQLSDCLVPPKDGEKESDGFISPTEVRKVLRASEMEVARARLRAIPKSLIHYSEFLEICCHVSAVYSVSEIARRHDSSGDVIVLGNVVYLHPHQVAMEIARMVPMSMDHNENCSGLKEVKEMEEKKAAELKEMEETKAEIDRKAEALAKRELWCGLGFLAAQTLWFARLTFWELSWDVMEPVCFFTASTYFMAGYGFFLRTSREPSFEGFFASRLAAKKKRLMEAYEFDLRRFDELKRDFTLPTTSCSCCGCHKSSAFVGNAH